MVWHQHVDVENCIMARYCTAVTKEKKESGKAQDQERAVALLVQMENGEEEGIDYVPVEEIRSC